MYKDICGMARFQMAAQTLVYECCSNENHISCQRETWPVDGMAEKVRAGSTRNAVSGCSCTGTCKRCAVQVARREAQRRLKSIRRLSLMLRIKKLRDRIILAQSCVRRFIVYRCLLPRQKLLWRSWQAVRIQPLCVVSQVAACYKMV